MFKQTSGIWGGIEHAQEWFGIGRRCSRYVSARYEGRFQHGTRRRCGFVKPPTGVNPIGFDTGKYKDVGVLDSHNDKLV